MIVPYDSARADEWDDLVARSVNGTFLHTRRYIGYHGDRFTDRSLVVTNPKGRLVGVLPAALVPGDTTTVASHPGITYGGLVHDGSLRGEELLQALAEASAHFAAGGLTRFVYKAVPYVYHRVPAGDDLYALFRLGATRTRCDLSVSVDLAVAQEPNRNRRRNLDKARAAGLTVVSGPEWLPRFWPVLTENLRSRYGVDPVHSAAEIALLAELFPAGIECQAVLLGDELVGGVVLYKTGTVVHPQYSAATPRGKEVAALDAAFTAGIDAARAAGARYYDFGNSNEDGGRVLNASLYRYKLEYGGGGVPYEFYEVALS